MNFEEAKEIFLNRGYEQVDGGSIYNPDKWRESVIVISDWLRQEPCEDVISRAELLKAIDTWDKFGCDANTKLVPYQDHYVPYIHYDDVVKCIKGIPPVTPHPKIGYWIFTKTIFDKYGYTAECSSCHKKWKTYDEIAFKKEHDYCPNCGAKMREVEDGNK